MADRGLCSRREADHFIERGWVFVDGQRVSTLGIKVHPDQKIALDNRAVTHLRQAVTFLLNKPIGYVSAQPEKGYPAAVSLLRKENQYSKDTSRHRFDPRHCRGLAPAGRLDIDSQGLLVLTQDGRIARRLVGEKSGVEKGYLVRVKGAVDDQTLRLLSHGLSLDGKLLKPAQVIRQNRDQLRFTLIEGKKRQIRRMCALVGLKVTGLKRIRIGNIILGALPLGKWRYLRDDENF